MLVMKFGGSSLADRQRVERAARLALGARHLDRQPVMVVSAQGRTTDRLLEAAAGEGPPRELDALLATGEQISAALMAMAIHRLGGQACSLTGWQAGIRAEGPFGDGDITAVDSGRLRALCGRGVIPVVTGFQGVTGEGEILTLGRGGSDTTAVALARVLGARCRIYTDVSGVYTADPGKVPEARRHSQLDYAMMEKLAEAGAGVLHGKAARLAREGGVELEICSSLHPEEGGTRIGPEMPGLRAAGVSCHRLPEDGGLYRLTVVSPHAGDDPEIALGLQRGLARLGLLPCPLGGDPLCRWALIPGDRADEALREVHAVFFPA